jgi:hypothetical protein
MTRGGSLDQTLPDIATEPIGGKEYQMVQLGFVDAGIWLPVKYGQGLPIEGPIAHDSPIGTSRPVRLAARAYGGDPTAVTAGDVVDVWAGRMGQQVVAGYGAAADGSSNSPINYIDSLGNIRNGAAVPLLWSGVGFDYERNNQEIALVPSASRNATWTTGNFTNHNCRGGIFRLLVTVAGTGTLTISLRDMMTGNFLAQNFTAVSASDTWYVYPGISTTDARRFSALVPRTFALAINHSDGSPWTYKIDVTLIR